MVQLKSLLPVFVAALLHTLSPASSFALATKGPVITSKGNFVSKNERRVSRIQLTYSSTQFSTSLLRYRDGRSFNGKNCNGIIWKDW